MAINPAEISTIRVGELAPDTINLTSKIPIENGTDLYRITAQDLINFVNINANSLQFEIRDLWVSQAYIDTNFTQLGLGINLCNGYAICNGLNGTPNLDGLVSVGYGTNYNVVKAVGGSKNAVVVEHTHNVANGVPSSASLLEGSPYLSYFGARNDTNSYWFTGNTNVPDRGRTSTIGQSGENKNMQPYMVLLKIMKL